MATSVPRPNEAESKNSYIKLYIKLYIKKGHLTVPSHIMAFSTNSIRSICQWNCNDKDTLARWLALSPEQINRRVARYLGVTVQQILACGHKQEDLNSITACYLCNDICQDLDKTRIRHQKAYAAMWTYLLPEQKRARQANSKTLWTLQMCIGVAIAIGTLTEVHRKPYLRTVLR